MYAVAFEANYINVIKDICMLSTVSGTNVAQVLYLVSGNIRFVRMFAEVPWRSGIKQERSDWDRQWMCIAESDAVSQLYILIVVCSSLEPLVRNKVHKPKRIATKQSSAAVHSEH